MPGRLHSDEAVGRRPQHTEQLLVSLRILAEVGGANHDAPLLIDDADDVGLGCDGGAGGGRWPGGALAGGGACEVGAL